jgi:hypothetical protein
MSRAYFKYSAGLGQVGQYQMSGIPFATASFEVPGGGAAGAPLQLEFGGVTKFFTVINTHTGQSAPLRVGFSSQGVTGSGDNTGLGTKYFILDNGESYTAELRVTSIFLMGHNDATPSSASVIAGITGISESHLTGNWSGSLGVG